MTKDDIIKQLRDMAKHPTVTLPRDCEALRAAADLLAQQDVRDEIDRGAKTLRETYLAQPEQSENSDFQPDWMNYQQGYMDGMSQAIADMALEKDKPQPKEPEQEPVAKFDARQDAERLKSVGRGMSYNDVDEAVWKHTLMEIAMRLETGGYTTPPQRTWVGLTDEEIDSLANLKVDGAYLSVPDTIRQADAKLKEKNGC